MQAVRWEDESYVRFYRRSTPEWLSLSWQARGLFGLLLRELDRAGLLVLGPKLGLRGLAVQIQAPWVEIEKPLGELLVDGCVRWDEARGVLWVPNFIEAQEANQSDAQRKRESRARARDAMKAPALVPAVTKRDTARPSSENPVTKRDTVPSAGNSSGERVDGVTNRDAHDESQNVTETDEGVTRGHTRSLCAVPSVLSNQPARARAHTRVADAVPPADGNPDLEPTDDELEMLRAADRRAREQLGQTNDAPSMTAGPTIFDQSLNGKEPKR
jgi:hypothetical protein